MPLCNGADIGCVRHMDNITGRESGQTSLYGASHAVTCKAVGWIVYWKKFSSNRTSFPMASTLGAIAGR